MKLEKAELIAGAGLVCLGLCLLLANCEARASDAIVTDAYTSHSTRTSVGGKPWESPHRVSWQHDLSETLTSDIGLGTNSYGTGSASAGLLWQPLAYGTMRAGAFAALVSGYTCEQLKSCYVAAGFVASLTTSRILSQIVYIPATGKGTTSITQLRLGVVF